ncbi:MAG: hypothetical protein FJ387_27340, partial [Verrucomicrobia bacterium]|nr:hypothetical protein [Verrucomicrobiota bacterium]
LVRIPPVVAQQVASGIGNVLRDLRQEVQRIEDLEVAGRSGQQFLVARLGESAHGIGVFLRERAKDQAFFLCICFSVPHSAGTRSMRQRRADDALYRTTYRDQKSQIPLPPGYIAEADVRTPKLPPDTYSGKQIASYDYRRTPETLQEQRVRVCQTVTGIDRVVGQILEQLKRLGQADNTIIVYSSDNGILHGEHGYGGKCLLYDPSIRVPLIIHDPRLPADRRGRRVKELVVSQDVAPTLLDLCGITAPATMQGRSLRPLLHGSPRGMRAGAATTEGGGVIPRGEKVEWRSDVFCESLILLQDYPLIQGVRSADWKYIRYWPNRETPIDYRELLNLGLNGESPAYEELFHLTADPFEQTNLASDPRHASQLAAMRARCVELLRETRGDPQALPSMPVAEWANETPGGWKDVLPLLSRRNAAKGE